MKIINLRYIIFISLLLCLIAFNPVIKTIIISTCLALCLGKNLERSLMAFSITQMFFILNGKIFGFITPLDTLLRILIFILPFFLILVRTYKLCLKNKIFLFNSFFSLWLLISNLLINNNSLITLSLLKIILYYSGSSYIILAFGKLKTLSNFISWFIAIGINFILFSLFIYIFSFDQGIFGHQNLFHGAFVHPNQVGITLIPFLIFFANEFNNVKKNNLFLAIIVTIFFLVFLSGARGSVVSLFLCVTICILISFFKKSFFSQLKNIFNKNKLLIIFSIIFLLLFFSSIELLFREFLLKGEYEDSNSTELFYQSRGWRILLSLENFYQNPYLGIGFGVPTIIENVRIKYDPIFNFPISAPVEKSFFFSGILEEMGIIGFFVFFIFYFKWSKIIIKNVGSIFMLAIFISIFTLSIFEFQFFSMGIYGFNWLWLGLITSLALNKRLNVNPLI